ncbi:hypothetical protein J7E99_36700 [Streptomyces sp. ISL-44]|uniref:hypothetical protein n=1 Tax=Streptomyces sp. ISL-44 TaxID=2819184 RepID=UPI001BEA454F|nr:hypothetical protein [Streptomyces sp. ISL-44]MBT2546060.1 hypothetical protein [Streptomyces sp. ISL-44]
MLGTGPRPTTDSPASTGQRALLASELAARSEPAPEASAARTAAAPGRRRLGLGATHTR